MPHALSMPAPGFQAVILCGPGVSFDTFTSNPEESPKALIPIANRPMVWYPLDFCYRMGVTSMSSLSFFFQYRNEVVFLWFENFWIFCKSACTEGVLNSRANTPIILESSVRLT